MKGKLNELETDFILDTGAGITVMGGGYYDKYLRDSIPLEAIVEDSMVTAANAQQMTVRGYCRVKIQLGDLEDEVLFKVIEEIRDEIILGNDSLYKWNARIDLGDEEVELGTGNWLPIRIWRLEEGTIHLTKSIKVPPRSG